MFKRFFLGDPSAIRTRDTLIKSQIQKLCSKHYFYAFFREISDIISVLKVYIFYYIYLFLNIFYQSNLSHSVKNQSILLSKQINHLKFIFLNYITPFLYFQYYPQKKLSFSPDFSSLHIHNLPRQPVQSAVWILLHFGNHTVLVGNQTTLRKLPYYVIRSCKLHRL